MRQLSGYGRALLALRERRGFSQRELCRRAGLGLNTILRAEKEQQPPRLETLDAILDALGFSLEDFARELRTAQAVDVAEPTPPYPDASRPALDPLDALLESAVASLSGLVAAVKERDRKM